MAACPNTITIALDDDTDSEHAEFLMNAILLLRGVSDAKIDGVASKEPWSGWYIEVYSHSGNGHDMFDISVG